MSRAETFARVWRKSPHAYIPPALAFVTWFAAMIAATAVPVLGLWPFAAPFVALLGWAAAAHRRLRSHVSPPRGARARAEPSAAALLARSPLGAAVLGVAGMAVYFLVVGTLLRQPWLGSDAAVGAYSAALMGVAGALCVWEIVFGAEARRARRQDRSTSTGVNSRRRDG